MPGPDYISWSEWDAIRKGRAKRRRLGSAKVLASLAVIAAGIVLFPQVLLTYRIRSLVAALGKISDYACSVTAYDPDGKSYDLRFEAYSGASWRVNLFGDAVSIVKNNQGVSAYERDANELRRHKGWFGSQRILDRIKAQIQRASAANGAEYLGRNRDSGREEYRFRTADHLYQLATETDGPDTRIATCSVMQRDVGGWLKVMDMAFEYGPQPPFQIDAPEAKIVDSGNSPTTALKTFRLGPANARLVSADVNASGCAFFDLDQIDTGPLTTNVTDLAGSRVYVNTTSEEGKDRKKRLQIELVPVGNKVEWPFKALIQVRRALGDHTEIGEFEYAASGPTCFLEPRTKLAESASDEPYFENLYRTHRTLENYYEFVFRLPDGRPLFGGAQGVPPKGAKLDVHDRVRALDEARRELFFLDQLGDDPRSIVVRVYIWIDVYHVLKSIGRSQEARRALLIAREEAVASGAPPEEKATLQNLLPGEGIDPLP